MSDLYKSEMAAIILKLNNAGVAFKDSCEGLKTALSEIERGLFEGGLRAKGKDETMKASCNVVGAKHPLDHYDATEVAGCSEDAEGNVDRLDDDEGVPPTFWCVYLHLKKGHVEAVADLPSKELADKLAAVLEECIAAVNGGVLTGAADTTDYKEDLHKYGGF
jgi:hypothetical protein